MSYSNKEIINIKRRTNNMLEVQQNIMSTTLGILIPKYNATSTEKAQLMAYKKLLDSVTVNWETYQYLEIEIERLMK